MSYVKTEESDTPDLAIPPAQPQSDDEFDEEGEGILADHEGVEYYEDAGFKIKQVPSPTIVQRSLNDLYNLSLTKYLKLDPEYQRDVVWDEVRSSALIASVLQGYFIPPIIFNVICEYEPLNDGSGKKMARHYRICVDGKQRLTSVKKFMEGDISVLDSSSPPRKWFYSHPKINGVEKPSNHNILPESTKSFFRSRMFCCYEYSDMPQVIEENMFQLVQRGMPLTPAERMRALSTKWANFAKMFEEDYPMVVNVSKQGRASGFRAVTTIFCQILEVMHPSGNKKTNREGVSAKPILQASPQVLTKLLLDNYSLSEAVKATLKKVFDRFQKLVDACSRQSNRAKLGYTIKENSAFDPAPDFLRETRVGHVKTFSPLELLATAILLLVHMDKRTDAMLLGDVKELRYYLRENHKDLRLNNLCWTTAWDFIDEEMIRRRGGEGAVPQRRSTKVRNEEVEIISDDELGSPNIVPPPATHRQLANAVRQSTNQHNFQPEDSHQPTSMTNGVQPSDVTSFNGQSLTVSSHSKPSTSLSNAQETGETQSLTNNSLFIPAPRTSIRNIGGSQERGQPIQPRKRNYDIGLGQAPSFRETSGQKKPRAA